MSKPSLLRRHTARLVLLVAAAASMACDPSRSAGVETRLTGKPFTLRTEEPATTRRHFRVRVSADRAPSSPVDLDIQGRLTSHWRPDDPTDQRKPVIRARFTDFYPDWGSEAGFGVMDDMSSLHVRGFRNGECDLKQGACEWLVPLDIQLQPRNTTGAVDVQWELFAQVTVSGDKDPPGFAVQLAEE